MQPGRGSLAEVLPASLLARFAGAATGDACRRLAGVVWRARTSCASVRPPTAASEARTTARAAAQSVASDSDYSPLADRDCATPDRRVGDRRSARTSAVTWRRRTQDSDRLVGSLVHRLLQREGLAGPVSDDVGRGAARLARARGRVDRGRRSRGADPSGGGGVPRLLVASASLRALYQSGAAFHEVPFSLRGRRSLVRGTIDCLVRGVDGSVTVLEFKTGRPRPSIRHRRICIGRPPALFPDSRVVTQLLYASEAAGS